MFKEEVRTRESLNSAMDALDRLGKRYTITKKTTNRECGWSMDGTPSIQTYTESSWIIEEEDEFSVGNIKVKVDVDTTDFQKMAKQLSEIITEARERSESPLPNL